MRRLGLLLCLLLGLASSVYAQQPPFVVILLPGTSLKGWQDADAPRLHHLMATGALAVMNTRTARLPNDHTRETPQSAALTLGAGARAAGGPEAAAFLIPSAMTDAGVSAADLYTRRVGQRPSPGLYVNTSWPILLRANERLGYRLKLGSLAEALTAKGVTASAGGGPYADCVAATSDGTVRRAKTLATTEGQCLVWDAGSDIHAADGLIGWASSQVARLHGRLLVLSPSAGDAEYGRGERLTPILEWGEEVPPGLLRSLSTRRAGLVVNTDFAPTVGAYFGIRREDFTARPFGEVWTVTATPDAGHQAASLEREAVNQAKGMKALPYLAVALAVWIIGGTALALRKRLPAFWPVAPSALLVALVFSTSSLSLAFWFGILLAAALASLHRFGPRTTALLLLSILAAALVGDMLTGSRLMQRGLLGYSAIEGARYYGIGNEAMGALIGAMLVVIARLWQPLRRVRWLLLLLLGIVALLLGSVGAKAGGLLVSLAAFGTLGFHLSGRHWTGRAVLTLAVVAVTVLTLAAVGDAVGWFGAHSHMGEAVRRIQDGGWSEAGDIVGRKLAVDGHLAVHSAWAFPLWAGLLCLAVLWRRQNAVTLEERSLRVAGVVGIAACVALNDAGVVAGVLCLVPIWCDSAFDGIKEKTPATA